MNRKQLRRELKELMIPVMENLHKLGKDDFIPVMDINHNGEQIQAQFHGDKTGLTVFIMYWYGVCPAFKIGPEQIIGMVRTNADWLAGEFVKANEHLIGRVIKSKKATQ